MNIALGVSWEDRKKGRLIGGFMALLVGLSVAALPVGALTEAGRELVSVIVRELPGSGDAPERAVEALGGEVGRHIGIIDGFVAEVPEAAISRLRSMPVVHSVTPDARIRLLSNGTFRDDGSSVNVTRITGARTMWQNGYTGAGVDVALIDSGVLPVNGLTVPGKVINGLDISFEAPADNLRHLDTYGHGTNMAGIIAGRDDQVVVGTEFQDKQDFIGMAPGARIVNVKVANAHGATDVSQVIAAIDWVVQHRGDNGMNIRVLNLSFGTDGVQDYVLDPLTFAAEVAWRNGIVVVVAAGNSQFGDSRLNNPAYDPFVIAVGAVDTMGTYPTNDDVIPAWSARGDGVRNPDVVAPGLGIVSLRAPGSFLDQRYPEAVREDRFFRGSGTSQAAAVVSGAAALLMQQRPGITPDQVKALLKQTAAPLPAADPVAQGSGLINLQNAITAPTPADVQTFTPATGVGSLDAARGTARVEVDGVVLSGERDIHGSAWDGVSWSTASLAGVSWSGGTFNGVSWSGVSWSGVSWSGVSWSGVSWSGVSWSGVSWSGVSWSGVSWSGVSWSGVSWSGVSWSGVSWSGVSWSGVSWSGVSWG